MPKPFDLELAKQGKPLVTRSGEPAKFIAHIPECGPEYRVVALIAGEDQSRDYLENGLMWDGEIRDDDLFMADPPTNKITVYLNWYNTGNGFVWRDKETAEMLFGVPQGCVKAYPVEIEVPA